MEQIYEERQRGYRIFLAWLISLAVIGIFVYYIYSVKNLIPNTLNLSKNSVEEININIPFLGTVEQKSAVTEAISYNVSSEKSIDINLLEPLNISTGECSSYYLDFKLFGLFSVKRVTVNVCEDTLAIPCGIPIGIYVETNGVMVVDIGDITLEDGTIKCPASEIIWPGDYIISIDGVSVTNKAELVELVNMFGEKNNEHIIIGLIRNGEEIEVKLKPVKDSDGIYKIGTWVRDDCQGLGTLTYIDENNSFGALGHGISDVDTGKLVNIEGGRLYCAKIWSLVRGKAGTPGEVVGSINYNDSYYLGEIEENTEIGIYGICDDNLYNYIDSYALPVCFKQEVEEGTAYVRSFVDGTVKDYEITITDTDISNNNINKGISFTVTDEELLEITGGIIQGMSGSPIIQNDKLIGAVTHVLVNDPAKGYGIFIENMLEHN